MQGSYGQTPAASPALRYHRPMVTENYESPQLYQQRPSCHPGSSAHPHSLLLGWVLSSPSSGAELSAELSLSELPEEAVLLACFFMVPFFSIFLAFPFFLFLLLPNVHYKEGKKGKLKQD